MTSRKPKTIKDISIELLEIADINFLANMQDITPEDVEVEVNPEVNTIKNIVRHCSRQMDRTIESYTGQRIMKDKVEYSFKDIIDMYLEISQSFFGLIKELDPEDFNSNPGGTGEILYKRIQRIALHYLGHTGQIVLIRKMLGKGVSGAYSFVKAMSAPTRKKTKKEWMKWWEQSKNQFE